MPKPMLPQTEAPSWWSLSPDDLMRAARAKPEGLTTADADRIRSQVGANALNEHRRDTALSMLLKQFTDPLVLILLFAAVVSAVVHEWTGTIIVMAIITASALLSFSQEYAASNAVETLRKQVTLKATVLRDGQPASIAAEAIVPGDIVLLSAGSLVPADGVVLEAKDFFVNQAVLTGETYPVEKAPGAVAAQATLNERHNMVFMGTNVRSGTARVLVVTTGTSTAFGQIADRLTLRPPETEFERGIRRFGYLLTRIMMALVAAIFVINALLEKPVVDSLLFAIALAVGLTPELLPAIISISLSRGAQRMARENVIVRRLNAIENLGSVDVLCTDKTGTITQGVVRLDGALDTQGQPNAHIARWAYLNALYQTGIANPLDEAVLAMDKPDIQGFAKADEIPFDFQRKRLSIVVDDQGGARLMISKGALANILAVCTDVLTNGERVPLDDDRRADIDRRFSEWSGQGYRVLGVAVGQVPEKAVYSAREDEQGLALAGFLLFFDPPKEDVAQTIQSLAQLGVTVKIITGDNRLVARHVAGLVGLPKDSVLPADAIRDMQDEALWHMAEKTAIFAEVDPNQKERIILALKKTGHVVAYMGDGINDAPALHAADVGISVESAVDAAREAADFVLLKRDLGVLLSAIKQGRTTFSNTLKYIYTTTGANFGNMLSMAGASLFLPFLPLLAKQILLNNFLSDLPAIGIPSDNVDPEDVARPRKWDTGGIRNFMLLFGLVSSVFDYATFGLLLFIAHATEAQFQTGWFVESLLSELVVALVVRTRRRFYQSKPGKALWAITLAVSLAALVIPYLPLGDVLGFVPLPLWLLAALIGVTALYVVATEAAKGYFFSRLTRRG